MELLIKRVLATLIDTFIISIPSMIINTILGLIGFFVSIIPFMWGVGRWISSLGVFFILFVLYNTLMEYLYGGTIGKKLLKIKVISEDETLFSIFCRSFLKTVSISSFYSFFAVCSIMLMVFSDPKTSIHDKLMNTYVDVK